MTTLFVRPPLQDLSMSSIQSGSRRQSARLQQKEDHGHPTDIASTNGHQTSGASMTTKVQTSAAKSKKRKNNYDEEDDGFVFSRVKKKKPRQSLATQPDLPVAPPIPPPAQSEQGQQAMQPTELEHKPKPTKKAVSQTKPLVASEPQENVEDAHPKKRQKRRMSFSTPSAKEPQPVRRSKRLSTDPQPDSGSPSMKPPNQLRPPKIRKERVDKHKPPAQQNDEHVVQEAPIHTQNPAAAPVLPEDETHSATKIALPFADTPVISRNKAMREGKSGKIERRSSLGLRGRRASSLIDSGNSNALPHSEVEFQSFYKHIESELTEPRRMRQLLTWCATRAMHPKPQGTSYAEASARSVARVIEEELLKDLANKPELSEWFSREDDAVPAVPLPERPNPKNTSNATKISELEEQIRRLRSEKEALTALKKPPSIPEPLNFSNDLISEMESILTESDTRAIHSLRSQTQLPAQLATKVNKIITNLGQSIDVFADGVHRIHQYRIGSDHIASQVLSICADKMAQREKEGRRKALGLEEDRSPARDLSSVLRGLSKADR